MKASLGARSMSASACYRQLRIEYDLKETAGEPGGIGASMEKASSEENVSGI